MVGFAEILDNCLEVYLGLWILLGCAICRIQIKLDAETLTDSEPDFLSSHSSFCTDSFISHILLYLLRRFKYTFFFLSFYSRNFQTYFCVDIEIFRQHN